MSSSYIFIGVITGPFGIEGGIRFKNFADSQNLLNSYKVFYNKEGSQEFKVKKIRWDKKDTFIIYFDRVMSRTEAEKIKGQKLYIKSSQLNDLQEEEYYHYHLIGLEIFDNENKKIGVVEKITDYGSGDLLEILVDNTNSLILIPFNKRFVQEIQLEQHRMIVDKEDIEQFLTLNGSV